MTSKQPVVRETAEMIAGMQPALQDGAWVFRSFETAAEAAPHLARARAMYHEAEGISLILPDDGSDAMAMACITLEVHSALDGVGLTAAVATALTEAAIPCNMVAAFHHDHVYVPLAKAEAAMTTLLALSARAREAR